MSYKLTNMITRKDIEDSFERKPITKEPDFVKMYFKDIAKLWELSPQTGSIFGQIVKQVEYAPNKTIHNYVYLSPKVKKEIADNLGYTKQASFYTALSRALPELINSELIRPLNNSTGEIQKDCYLVNPDICTRTNWAQTEFMRSIKLQITYEKSQRTLITLIEELPDDKKQAILDRNKPKEN